jgi:hypothetical protein
MLLQWVDDEVETVHADASVCIAMSDAPMLWTYEITKCSTRVDFFRLPIHKCMQGRLHTRNVRADGNQLNHK